MMDYKLAVFATTNRDDDVLLGWIEDSARHEDDSREIWFLEIAEDGAMETLTDAFENDLLVYFLLSNLDYDEYEVWGYVLGVDYLPGREPKPLRVKVRVNVLHLRDLTKQD